MKTKANSRSFTQRTVLVDDRGRYWLNRKSSLGLIHSSSPNDQMLLHGHVGVSSNCSNSISSPSKSCSKIRRKQNTFPFHNTYLTWGVCELIEKNFSMHVRTTAGVSFTTACTATPTRHAHRASVATYMQQHQHQQQAALHALVHAKKICQHAGSCITCTVCTSYLPRSGLHHHHQSVTCTRRRRRLACVGWTGGKKKYM